MKTRIAKSHLLSERLAGAFENLTVAIFDGDVEVGLIEYVGIKRHGVTRYGWRPVFSSRTGAQLLTKREAAELVARKAGAR